MEGTQPLPFEKALKRLEEVVEQLEAGEATLEESIQLFDEGMKLIHFCGEKLEWAEQRVDMLVKENDQWLKKPFHSEGETDD